jgi:hypothetical protein
MSNERRYQDHEVRQILELAVVEEESPARLLPAGDGLTLVELQEVASQVGVPPSRIAKAAADFEARGESLPRGKALGLPVSVGRVLQLPRNPTDREWELMIAELRTTFGGKGEVTSHGGLREWSQGTMHAFVEPTETGHRLRLTDSNIGAVGGVVLGGALLAFALLIFIVLLGKDDPGFRFAVPGFFSLIGGGLITGGTMALPRWARDQEERMEHIGRYAVSLLGPHESRDDNAARPLG